MWEASVADHMCFALLFANLYRDVRTVQLQIFGFDSGDVYFENEKLLPKFYII